MSETINFINKLNESALTSDEPISDETKRFVKGISKEDRDAGKSFSTDDFNEFKKRLKANGLSKFTDKEYSELFDYYFECYNDEAMKNLKESVNWDYFNRFEDIYQEYMPDIGEGETLASQTVTAVNKLIYKWYNDGDVFDNVHSNLRGWANDLSSFANWLYKYVPGKTQTILKNIYGINETSDYEYLLKELADYCLNEDLLQSLKTDKQGSVYRCDGPFEFNEDEYKDGEYDDEEDWSDDEDNLEESKELKESDESILRLAKNSIVNGKLPEEIKYKGKTYKQFYVTNSDNSGETSDIYYCNMENTPSGDPQESNDYFYLKVALNKTENGYKGIKEIRFAEDLTESKGLKESDESTNLNQVFIDSMDEKQYFHLCDYKTDGTLKGNLNTDLWPDKAPIAKMFNRQSNIIKIRVPDVINIVYEDPDYENNRPAMGYYFDDSNEGWIMFPIKKNNLINDLNESKKVTESVISDMKKKGLYDYIVNEYYNMDKDKLADIAKEAVYILYNEDKDLIKTYKENLKKYTDIEDDIIEAADGHYMDYLSAHYSELSKSDLKDFAKEALALIMDNNLVDEYIEDLKNNTVWADEEDDLEESDNNRKIKIGSKVYWIGAGNEISSEGEVIDFPVDGRMTIKWDDNEQNTYDIDHPDIILADDYDDSVNESENKIDPNNLTSDQLSKLRKDITLNSTFTDDYKNSLGIDSQLVQNFFDGYIEYLSEMIQEDIGEDKYDELDDNDWYNYINKYDTLENLEHYYNAVRVID